jgi:hypothetical protein
MYEVHFVKIILCNSLFIKMPLWSLWYIYCKCVSNLMQIPSLVLPLRIEVYFCHQNQNAKNIGYFTAIETLHWYSFERYRY